MSGLLSPDTLLLHRLLNLLLTDLWQVVEGILVLAKANEGFRIHRSAFLLDRIVAGKSAEVLGFFKKADMGMSIVHLDVLSDLIFGGYRIHGSAFHFHLSRLG